MSQTVVCKLLSRLKTHYQKKEQCTFYILPQCLLFGPAPSVFVISKLYSSNIGLRHFQVKAKGNGPSDSGLLVEHPLRGDLAICLLCVFDSFSLFAHKTSWICCFCEKCYVVIFTDFRLNSGKMQMCPAVDWWCTWRCCCPLGMEEGEYSGRKAPGEAVAAVRVWGSVNSCQRSWGCECPS